MTNEDKLFLDRITEFANQAMVDMDPDPQKTPISEQLECLRPIMEALAKEYGQSVEDVFIRYMDLASEAACEKQAKFKEDFMDFNL